MTLIRPALAEDLAAITDIYAHHVQFGTGTFETTPPSVEEIARRHAEVRARGLPWLVAERDTRVVGFAYCNWFKPRPAYRYSAEDSIYVAPDALGQGIGRALLAELGAAAERAGVRKLIAVIGDSANVGSIALHRSLGFRPAGTITACGWKFGRWLDIVLMDRALGWGDQTPPEREA
ncbi:phosphinothricin acetyltransferase [Tibeticola sediminis]|jgi:phosphinothricin acetyltransferase|uniref:Phosphinothricin acetyltransferase n=1 Tax=Tibeticola sediminis TaxID=1917811 RepID=A0A3N4UJ60_9BURK|nr:GNAT family N-acetyltransferase [Tibeticola sediminis]RPE65127.1 phosphinothricin acetyltransferase [Tibeticola sediminis]